VPEKVNRQTVDLTQYPDLVVIYLGMRVNRLSGLKTLLGFGPKIANSVAAKPDGLLLHENFVFSLFPMHVGMRQYWRDMYSLLSWSRSDPHLVESLSRQLRGHSLLARNIPYEGRHGGYLRRSVPADRHDALCSHRARARRYVWSGQPRSPAL